MAAMLLLAGCSSGSSVNPVTWWHNLEGGAIAQQRPPPPGADAPYPNLASVPPQPKPPDLKALNAVTSSLIADRQHAEHVAEATPLPDPSSRTASPDLFGIGTAPPPPPPTPAAAGKPASTTASGGPPATAPSVQATAPSGQTAAPSGQAAAPSGQGASATFSAATAPPARPVAQAAPETPPRVERAPVGAVKSTPLPGAQAYQPSQAAQAMQTTAAPAMPATPPAPPNVPGARPAPPPAPAQAAPSAPQGAVMVSFAPGSTTLPAGAADQLKPLVAKRGNATVSVIGHGDTSSNNPNDQATALTLGLARAQAVQAALSAQGVPTSAMQVGAQAGGRGVTVRLLQ